MEEKERFPKKNTCIWLCKRLRTLLQNGIPLVDALSLLKNDTDTPELAELAQTISNHLNQGTSFTEALATALPRTLKTSMPAVDLIPQLPLFLNKLETHLQSRLHLQSTISKKLIYPLCLLATLTATIALFFCYYLPQMHHFFLQLNTPIPAALTKLLALKDFISTHSVLLITSLLISIIAMYCFWQRRHEDKPSYSTSHTQFANTLFFMGTLMESGVAINTILNHLHPHSPNSAIHMLKTTLYTSGSFRTALKNITILSKYQKQLICTGESSGSLANHLQIVANDLIEKKTEKQLMLINLVQPTLLILLAGLIAASIFFMFAPLFSGLTILLG